MFRDLKPYSGYRAIPGLPVMAPAGWSVRPMRSLIESRSERGRPDLPLLTVARERGVFVRSKDDENHNAIPEDLSNYKVARAGDLVINKMKAWQGSLGLAPADGIVSPAYFVYNFTIGEREYGEVLLRSRPYVSLMAAASDGVRIGQWDLAIPRFRAIPVLVPPLDEQAAIVKYLGHAHARIDRAIAAKRKLIALLEEQKQSIINQAVTRGLDPAVPMKDSGIPWLGQVPAHWGVAPVGALTSLVQTGPFGSQLHAEEYVDGGIPVINPSHLLPSGISPDPAISISHGKATELARHRFLEGDVVVARRGELGRCAVVGSHEVGWVCGTGSLIARPRHEALVAGYLQRCISSDESRAQLGAGSIGATMANLNAQMIARLRVPLPPVAEQADILRDVEAQEHRAQRRRAVIQREVDVLREFRTRLTSDVVTGQLDVREIASTLPDFVEQAAVDADSGEDESFDELDEVLEEAEG